MAITSVGHDAHVPGPEATRMNLKMIDEGLGKRRARKRRVVAARSVSLLLRSLLSGNSLTLL